MQPTAQKNNAKQRKTIAIVAVIAVVAIALAAVAIIAVANKREMTQAASDTCTLNAKALATHQQNFEEAQKEAEDAAKLTVDDVADGICKKLMAKGFSTYSHENVIIVAPPLIITPEQLREEMQKLDEVLGEVDAAIAG